MWFLYILQCSDQSLYTGISTDVQRRIKEHSAGKGKGSRYVHGKLPVRLVYQERCKNRSSALKREAKIKKLGGFDKRYAPAYREDTDLAFQVRQAGRKVLYQPASKIIHYESVTAGSDTETDIRKYQYINHKKFKKKWTRELALMSASESKKPRVLVIDVGEPERLTDDIESLDLFEYIQLIQSLGYQVTFATEDLLYSHLGGMAHLQKTGVECLYKPYTQSIAEHLESHGSRYHSVFLCRPEVARIHMERIKNYCPEARIVEDTASLVDGRHYASSPSQNNL